MRKTGKISADVSERGRSNMEMIVTGSGFWFGTSVSLKEALGEIWKFWPVPVEHVDLLGTDGGSGHQWSEHHWCR